jgi:hypothetical protein
MKSCPSQVETLHCLQEISKIWITFAGGLKLKNSLINDFDLGLFFADSPTSEQVLGTMTHKL